jgi:hypothetical protein
MRLWSDCLPRLRKVLRRARRGPPGQPFDCSRRDPAEGLGRWIGNAGGSCRRSLKFSAVMPTGLVGRGGLAISHARGTTRAATVVPAAPVSQRSPPYTSRSRLPSPDDSTASLRRNPRSLVWPSSDGGPYLIGLPWLRLTQSVRRRAEARSGRRSPGRPPESRRAGASGQAPQLVPASAPCLFQRYRSP